MDEDAARRRRAVLIAGHEGDIATVRAHIDDAEPGVRSAVVSSLHRLGALEPADLSRALADADASVRRRALEVIAALEGAGPATGVSILPLLSDADDTVVEVAAWASGERSPTEPGAVRALATLATDADDALIREAAVAALGSIGDPAGLPAILHGAADKATVRRRAVLALAPFEGPEVDAALERALSDRDWQVRQAAEDLSEPSN